jgi:hypothetical protein
LLPAAPSSKSKRHDVHEDDLVVSNASAVYQDTTRADEPRDVAIGSNGFDRSLRQTQLAAKLSVDSIAA